VLGSSPPQDVERDHVRNRSRGARPARGRRVPQAGWPALLGPPPRARMLLIGRGRGAVATPGAALTRPPACTPSSSWPRCTARILTRPSPQVLAVRTPVSGEPDS